MEHNIKVYVHGRPQGQDIWCANEDPIDYHYLNPFLDSKVGSDVPAAMIIDVWQKHAYYTYIRRKNVFEKSLRPDAYFAITVRTDDILKNSSTMFNLLDQVYNKLCVGELVEHGNSREHIIVSHWKEKEQVLHKIAEIISLNMEKRLIPAFTTIEEAKDTNEVTPKKWALNDVDCQLFIDECQKYRIVISPDYKTKDNIHDEDVKRMAPLESKCKLLDKECANWKILYETENAKNKKLDKQVKELGNTIQELQSQILSIKEKVARQHEKEMAKTKNDYDSIKKEPKQEQDKNEKLQKKIKKSDEAIPQKGNNSNTQDKVEYAINNDKIRKHKNRYLTAFVFFSRCNISRMLNILNTLLLIIILLLTIKDHPFKGMWFPFRLHKTEIKADTVTTKGSTSTRKEPTQTGNNK